MKKFLSIFLLMLAVVTVRAQTPPEAFNYSAVARDASGTPITNTTIGIQMSIKIGSPLGATVYQENHFVNTDDFGLFNLIVGGGSVLNGSISGIDWSADDYYLQVGMDASGGASFQTIGNTQLLSVPYALYAKNAGSIGGGGASNSFYLGQDTLGGIVFYIYIGNDGNQHGLIVNKNQSSGNAWQTSPTAVNATSTWDGAYNTGLMTGSPAATYVNGLTDGGFTDWYLPSVDELRILFRNCFHVNKALNASGFTLLQITYLYWSSTESASTFAFAVMDGWRVSSNGKGSNHLVRAIRQF